MGGLTIDGEGFLDQETRVLLRLKSSSHLYFFFQNAKKGKCKFKSKKNVGVIGVFFKIILWSCCCCCFCWAWPRESANAGTRSCLPPSCCRQQQQQQLRANWQPAQSHSYSPFKTHTGEKSNKSSKNVQVFLTDPQQFLQITSTRPMQLRATLSTLWGHCGHTQSTQKSRREHPASTQRSFRDNSEILKGR